MGPYEIIQLFLSALPISEDDIVISSTCGLCGMRMNAHRRVCANNGRLI